MPPQISEQSRWFAAQILPHEPMLRAWLRRLFPTEGEIDDIVQDAYIRILWAHAAGEMASPKAFLFATARNLARDRFRHRHVARAESLVENEALAVLEDVNGVPETVARNEELEMLNEAIQSLPARCRQIFTLRKVYGLSQSVIAARMAISECTVSAQLTIGLQKCTAFMARFRRD